MIWRILGTWRQRCFLDRVPAVAGSLQPSSTKCLISKWKRGVTGPARKDNVSFSSVFVVGLSADYPWQRCQLTCGCERNSYSNRKKSVWQEFSDFSGPSSWSHNFKGWRGEPEEEWWAVEQGLLSKSTKLPETKTLERVVPGVFTFRGFYELFCGTSLSDQGVLSLANQGSGHMSVYLLS